MASRFLKINLYFQTKQIPSMWRAVCARFRYLFTETWWFSITCDSNFMLTSFSQQSEHDNFLRFVLGLTNCTTHCSYHCNTFVAQFIKAIRTWHLSHLPPIYKKGSFKLKSVYNILYLNKTVIKQNLKRVALV